MPTKSFSNITTISKKDPVLVSPSLIEYKGYTTVDTLNDWIEADIKNYARLLEKISDVESDIAVLSEVLSSQTSSYSAAVSTIENTINDGSYTDYNGIYFDMHSTTGINTGTSTAQLDTQYGQAIVPPVSNNVANQFVLKDSLTRNWVPKETKIYVGHTPTETAPTIWLEEEDRDNIIRAFDDKPFTVWSTPPSDTFTWFEVRYPVSVMSNRLTNAIVVHPYPEFGSRLIYAGYLTSSGSWVSLEGPYLTGSAPLSRKRRWVIPPTAIDKVRFCYANSHGSGQIGAYLIGSYYYEWQSSATLALDTADWNDYSTMQNVTITTPSSTVPSASWSATATSIDIAMSLQDDNTPHIVEGIQVIY